MNSEPRPAPPEISSRSGSAPLHRSRQLLWASAPLLLACLLVSRPADAQSFGLGLSTASGSAPSQSSVWVGVRLGLHGSPTYGRGVSWTSPGQTFGHRPRPRRWRSHSPAVWSVWPACWDVVRGPLPRGFHGCSPPWGYGFRWSRPAFAWAHYPLPLPYGGHSYLGDGVRSGGWSLSLHLSFGRPSGYGWRGGRRYAAAGYGRYVASRFAPWAARRVSYVIPGPRSGIRSGPRALRTAAPPRVGSGGWVSRARVRRETVSPSAPTRAATTRTRATAPAGEAQPAHRRTLSRSGPVTNQRPASSNFRRAAPRASVTPRREAGRPENTPRVTQARRPRPAAHPQGARPAPRAGLTRPARATASQMRDAAPPQVTRRSPSAPTQPRQVLGRSGPRNASPAPRTRASSPGRRTAR